MTFIKRNAFLTFNVKFNDFDNGFSEKETRSKILLQKHSFTLVDGKAKSTCLLFTVGQTFYLQFTT